MTNKIRFFTGGCAECNTCAEKEDYLFHVTWEMNLNLIVLLICGARILALNAFFSLYMYQVQLTGNELRGFGMSAGDVIEKECTW